MKWFHCIQIPSPYQILLILDLYNNYNNNNNIFNFQGLKNKHFCPAKSATSNEKVKCYLIKNNSQKSVIYKCNLTKLITFSFYIFVSSLANIYSFWKSTSGHLISTNRPSVHFCRYGSSKIQHFLLKFKLWMIIMPN